MKILPNDAGTYNPRQRPVCRGRLDEAIVDYRKALVIRPDYAEAHTTSVLPCLAADGSTRPSPISGRPWKSSLTTWRPTTTLVSLLPAAGVYGEAIAEYRKAMELKPDFAEARANLDAAIVRQQADLKALAQRRESLRSKPNMLPC